ncbi:MULTISPECIES: DUF6193 family natural product biosynthesis protein [unclassified Streptomyces]|uniref:DUF6193 family natural product biosynthesis protein n=1 Tax=unclassified Streptomyces TaxID=2593676 RepID=UPI002DD89B87|nr:DUF6193 family natural product biosynthesis protein [Streptomyces sp. NBC_01750]WSB02380.1 DUF6193 family natural product biosynthesis protein [Streptomyces sp. NBC_01794]WSD33343.1 DUF6193 family natural product biosynthesis protein [Streptomyces sp. NBC_01750]
MADRAGAGSGGQTPVPVDATHYQDVAAAGGLVAALGKAADEQGFAIGPIAPPGHLDELIRAWAVTNRGTFLVSADSTTKRVFRISIWAPGVELGSGACGNLNDVAAAVHGWSSGKPVQEMVETWPFIEFEPLAEAHLSGHAVATAWRLMLEKHPRVQLADAELTAAAHAQPRLRQLFPIASHGWFHFSRCTRDPFSNDLPMVGPVDGGWRVYGADAGTIGDVATAAEAAALVVAHLPHDIGPAVEGQLPPSQP